MLEECFVIETNSFKMYQVHWNKGTPKWSQLIILSNFFLHGISNIYIYGSFYYTLTSQLVGYVRMVTFKRSIPPRLQQRQSVVTALVEAFPSDLKLLSNPCSWKFACALTNVTVKISNAMQNHPTPPKALENQEFYDKWAWIKHVDARSDAKNAPEWQPPRPRCQSWDENAPQCLVHAHCCLKQIIVKSFQTYPIAERLDRGSLQISQNIKRVYISEKLNYLDTRKPVQSAESGTWDLVTVTSGCSPSKDVTWMRWYLESKTGVYNIYLNIYIYLRVNRFENVWTRDFPPHQWGCNCDELHFPPST